MSVRVKMISHLSNPELLVRCRKILPTKPRTIDYVFRQMTQTDGFYKQTNKKIA